MKRHFGAESRITGLLAKEDKKNPGPSWKIEDRISGESRSAKQKVSKEEKIYFIDCICKCNNSNKIINWYHYKSIKLYRYIKDVKLVW